MKKKSVIGTFAGYYKPHLGLFAVDMACALFISAVDVVYPLFANKALDEYLPGGQYRAFFLVAALSLAAYILRGVMQYTVTSVGHSLGVRMEADMRRDVFSHIQELSFSFYDKTRTGALMSRCTNDLFEVTELAHHGPEDLFVSLLTFVGSFAVMLAIEWRLALVLLVSIPVMFAIVFALRARMLRESRRVKEGLADVNSSIESSISGVRVSQAFTNEHYEIEKFKRGNEQYVRARRGYYNVMGEFFASLDFFTNALKIIVLGVGGYMIIEKKMDMVAMLTFSLYVTSFTAPIRKLTMFAETYVAGMAGFRRFTEIMDMEPEIKDSPSAVELPAAKGDIRLENVDFFYDSGAEVLTDLSLHIEAGSTVALVGPSGGGKTTVCHLLPRFYDVKAGRITIDGMDVRDVTLRSLRASIGIVQQDVFLFAGSIRENIRYGRMDATDEEIIAAAMAAEIHEDIMAMPGGYDTIAGERGVTLSGGQKQRISIARIFLKNPPILILDEATSALDSVTEARISEAFERLSRGRTTIMIAHRLSTVKNADTVIVIDGGKVTEHGSHEELMALSGEYAGLYKAQMQQ